jgi:hypothetical protein
MIPLNRTVIRDNDVSGRRFEELTSIWVYDILIHNTHFSDSRVSLNRCHFKIIRSIVDFLLSNWRLIQNEDQINLYLVTWLMLVKIVHHMPCKLYQKVNVHNTHFLFYFYFENTPINDAFSVSQICLHCKQPLNLYILCFRLILKNAMRCV